MRSHDRIRSHDRCDPIERLPAKAFALRGESPPLLVGQAKPTTLHLLLQDPVLLDQVCDDFLLVAIHPA